MSNLLTSPLHGITFPERRKWFENKPMQRTRLIDFGRATVSGQAARNLACRSSASTATDTTTSTATAPVAEGELASSELREHGAAAADMVVVNVDLGERSYPIYIGAGILDQGDLLRRSVTDAENVSCYSRQHLPHEYSFLFFVRYA